MPVHGVANKRSKRVGLQTLQQPLVVACEPSAHKTTTLHTFGLRARACRSWNADVRLSGIAVERVFLDPRARMRVEASPSV
jgi:hypothetical protein